MTQQNNSKVVRRSVVVPVPVQQAFTAFTEGISDWWPSANTFGKDQYETVVIEPHEGGRWYERDKVGNETVWGQVLTWDAPHRLTLTWQISPQGTPEPDSAKASAVDVRFEAEDPSSTLVVIEHHAFDRHGEEGSAIWYSAMDSEEGGWSHFLSLYKDATATA